METGGPADGHRAPTGADAAPSVRPGIEVSGGAVGAIGDGPVVHQHFYLAGQDSDRPPQVLVRVGRPPLEADAFQDRPSLLEQIEGVFAGNGTAVITQPAQPDALGEAVRPGAAGTGLVVGQGGVGKTQLAARVWRHHTRTGDSAGVCVDVALWVTGTSRAGITAGYAAAAAAVGVGDVSDPEAAALAFLNWLTTTDRSWLAVIDDLSDPADLKGLWPDPNRGRVLVTTRRRDPTLFGHGRHRIDVDVFTPDEAHDYLVSRLRHGGLPPGWDDPEPLRRLAEGLGFLPIGLAQACAYILNERIAPATFRDLLDGAMLSDVLQADGA